MQEQCVVVVVVRVFIHHIILSQLGNHNFLLHFYFLHSVFINVYAACSGALANIDLLIG